MKTRNLETILAGVVCAGLILSASVALAQNYSTTGSQMVYGVPQIIRLSQAKVSDDTIIAYVKNSGFSYNLDADQIINLRQQGVSDAVITTMLNQPKTGPVVYTPAAPAPQPVASSVNTSTAGTTPLYSPRQSDQMPAASASTQPVQTTTVAPTVTYVQTVPTPTYYYAQPYYQPYYYPSYAWFPPVSLSFAWGSGWHGGGYYGGWHGGGYGGWHGGGGWHH
jgi:hypothetical protein